MLCYAQRSKKDERIVEGIKLIAMKCNNNDIQTSIVQYNQFVTDALLKLQSHSTMFFASVAESIQIQIKFAKKSFEDFLKPRKKIK